LRFFKDIIIGASRAALKTMKKPSEAINIVNLDPARNSSGDNR
jgi:hypothetical protein